MSDEIAKCAWCGTEPEVKSYSGMTWYSHDCEMQPEYDEYQPCAANWNEDQARILAARKRDFEAGRSIKNDEHGWIYIFQSFDDYIKEGA